MRRRFEQQLSLGVVPISEVKIDTRSRHELPPVLRALQHVFVTPSLNESLFTLLEEELLSGKKKTGRYGMSLWEIVVLGVVKLNLRLDYDNLYDLSNNHRSLRGILGVSSSDFSIGKTYKYSTLRDNIDLLSEELLKQINELVVKGCHEIIKKKEGAEVINLSVKSDSYVIESKIHFPTDMNLLWDSLRKSLDMINHLKKSGLALKGWKHIKKWYSNLRICYRKVSEIHRKKGANYKERLQSSATQYLESTKNFIAKVEKTLEEGVNLIKEGDLSNKQYKWLEQLVRYHGMVLKHYDLLNRRVIKGEKIPHKEKVFSIFESHVEWNNKGKLHKKVELGHNTLIATDQYNLILDHQVLENKVDKQMTIEIGQSIAQKYDEAFYHLASISFDRNFYSGLAKKTLSKIYDTVILPKPGKKTQAQREEEAQEEFVQKRKAHSAVEANINQLEHHGLDKCPNKGMKRFKAYAALGVLAYNLHQMGKILLQMDREKEKLKKAQQSQQAKTSTKQKQKSSRKQAA